MIDTVLFVILAFIFSVILSVSWYFIGFAHGLKKFDEDFTDGAIITDEEGSYISLNNEEVLKKPYLRFKTVKSHQKQDL